MATSETDILRKIQLAATSFGSRLFRNNVGLGWLGKIRSKTDALVILENPRPVKYGLVVGSSDLIGWHSVTVTEQMVGRSVAVFAAIEVKTTKGRATPEQTAFLAAVSKAGGISAQVTSPSDFSTALLSWLKNSGANTDESTNDGETGF